MSLAPKQRQHPAVNCIDHKAECFISPPAEDRVHASTTALKQTAQHHPLGKDLIGKPTELSIFIIIYVSFQSRSKIKGRVKEEC